MASLWLAKAVRGNEEQLSYTRAELEDDIVSHHVISSSRTRILMITA